MAAATKTPRTPKSGGFREDCCSTDRATSFLPWRTDGNVAERTASREPIVASREPTTASSRERTRDSCSMDNVMIKEQHMLMEGLVRMSGPARKKLMLQIRENVTELALADPDMCDCVKGPIRACINLFWGDLMASVSLSLHDNTEHRDHRTLATLGDKPRICSIWWIRAKILYACLPFDVSIFGQLKDPLFLVCLTLMLIPVYGVRVLFYAFQLFLICMRHPDEFQLVQFIVLLKGTFFLTAGVIASVKASWGYLNCVHPNGTHTCNIDGPAYTLDVHSQAIDLGGSCVLAWVAFLALRYSMHHGYHKVSDLEAVHARHSMHGGHLIPLFYYDILCVVVSAGVFWFLAYADANLGLYKHPGAFLVTGGSPPPTPFFTEWDYHRAFLFARMSYALLSTPFVIFRLPGLNTILTHTSMTGYNRQGNCVAFVMRPMK